MNGEKTIVIIALVALVSSSIIPFVSATDYTYWENHYISIINGSTQVLAGDPPYGREYLYTDTPSESWPTIREMATELGFSPYSGYPGFKHLDSTGVSTTGVPWAGTPTNWDLDYPIVSGNFIAGSRGGNQSLSTFDGHALQCYVWIAGTNNIQGYGPMLIVKRFETPIISDFTYTPAEPWIAPANVTFSYVETGKKADQWYWHITGPGYGVTAAGYENITETFQYPGTYLVSLTVTNGSVEDTELKTFTVVNEAGSYSLTMSPESGTTGTNFTASIAAGVETLGATLNQFTMSCTVGGLVSYCTTDGKDPIFIKQEDGNWYLDGDLYSASFPSEIPLKFNVPGVHTVTGWFFTTDPADMGHEVSDTVTISSTPGEVKLTVEVRDAGTNALIGGSDILLKKEDGTWDNQTVGSGFRDYFVPGGNNIGIGATAAGYTASGIEYNRFFENAKKVVLLSRVAGPVPEGNNTLSVYVRKGGTADVIGLDGATVKLNDGQTKLTPASGLAQFLVLDAETYFITVSKPGYLTVSKYFAVNGAVNSVTIDMLVPGVTVTPTLAPGETPAPGTTTPAPGTTYPPGVPMPGTVTTYPPGVPVIGGDGGSVAGNATARDAAVKNLETWMLWGGTFLFAIFAIMFIGFSGDALKKWSWLWK